MRINKYVALATGCSRRQADERVASNQVNINSQPARMGSDVGTGDVVTLNGKTLTIPTITSVLLNKPVGYVCSRDGQGSQTIYELLPPELHILKPVGRLDKDSSGLLLLTNDGDLANQLTHPSYQKEKGYLVTLDKPLQPAGRQAIETGVKLEDGSSKLRLKATTDDRQWQVTMQEGRNRQIRRTFAAKGYDVTKLQRTQFGPYRLEQLGSNTFVTL